MRSLYLAPVIITASVHASFAANAYEPGLGHGAASVGVDAHPPVIASNGDTNLKPTRKPAGTDNHATSPAGKQFH